MMPRSTGKLTCALALAALTWPAAAFAYLDPGTGSMLLQLLIAGVLGALFTMKMWWFRFKQFVARMLGKDVQPALEADLPEGSAGDEPGHRPQ